MPVWGFAKSSIRVFLNFSFGDYFSQPLSDDQIVVTSKGVGCKDIYFNIQKINAILAESGIPVVVCVAYIAELVVCLPWSIELNGLDFVVQTSPDRCHPSKDDALLNSMISSMTAAAFAAAKVAGSSSNWFKTRARCTSPSTDATDDDDDEDNDDDDSDSEEHDDDMDSESESGKSNGLLSRIQRLFERPTKTAEGYKPDAIVDEDSKERVVYMIDSLIAQTSIVLRNVSLRVECQLGLPGLHRASGITLCFQYLSLANQSSAGQTPTVGQRNEGESRGSKDTHPKPGTLSPQSDSQPDIRQSSTSDGWSWLWPWGQTRKQSVAQGSTSSQNQPSTHAGSLSTMLHKIIRLENADIFWDLWDSSPKHSGGSKERHSIPQGEGEEGTSDSDAKTEMSLNASLGSVDDGEAAFSGPTEDNMVASAKLLTLSGDEHIARVSMRCPLFALAARTASPDNGATTGGESFANETTTNPFSGWSSFELRAHLDLGPVVACACPSQFYWLQLMVGQLNQIWQAYQDIAVTQQTSVQREPYDVDPYGVSTARTSNLLDTSDPRRFQLSSHLVQSSQPYEECTSSNPYQSELVDLDLSKPNNEPGVPSRAFIDSKLFWSCVSDSTEDANELDAAGTTTTYRHYPTNSHAAASSDPTPNADPKFSLAANVLCCALVVFYEDEPVSSVDDQCTSSADANTSCAFSSFRRSMLRSTLHESTKVAACEDVETEADGNSDAQTGCDDSHEPSSPAANTPTRTQTSGLPHRELAALPGPFYFFSRFRGVLPWRQAKPDENETTAGTLRRCRSNATLPRASSGLNLRTEPMRIDRAEVDMDQMTPSMWVSHLRRQFAELAAPRDHICFVGGLWHVEFCTRSIAPPTRNRQSGTTLSGSSTDFDAQLFGLELSECLFCDSAGSDSGNLDPIIHDILTFSDRFRGSSDRIGRIGSNNAAIKLSGMMKNTVHQSIKRWDRLQQDYDGTWPLPHWDSTIKTNSTMTGQVELSYCRLDVDISLTDRIHRITDAIAAAREAVDKFAVWGMQDSAQSSPEWRGNMFSDDLDKLDTQFRPKRQPLSALDPVTAPGIEVGGSVNDATNTANFKVMCVRCEVLLRFPVPLEAIKLDPPAQMSDLRKKLWSSGMPLWFSPVNGLLDETDYQSADDAVGPGALGLAWWRRTLRPEHLRICLDKLALVCRVGSTLPAGEWIPDAVFSGHTVQDTFCPNPQQSFTPRSADITENNTAPNNSESDAQIQLSLRSFFIHWLSGRSKIQPAPFIHLAASDCSSSEMITVFIRITSSGRTSLVEKPTDPHAPLDNLTVHQPVYAYSQQRFEMGVDLANPHAPNSGTLTSPVEWSLWKRAGPKQDLRTPFVIRRNFIQDAPKMHSKQTTYYPGDVNHLATYRQSASLHTWLFVRCKVPMVLVKVENKRTVELTYMRLMYDLLLWNSLLPSDRRLRATLTRRIRATCEPAPDKVRNYDHCCWFLSDPAPLASIYAHPEAAREAAAREAISSTGLHQTYGLHFHPLYSGDEDESDTFDDFDPGLDSVPDAARPNSRSPERRRKIQRNRKTPRTHSSDSEEDSPSGEGTTTIQRQSLCAIQLDVGSFDARITLPSLNNMPASSVTRDVVRVSGSEVLAFAELGHDGAPNVNFFTTEMNKLEIFVSPCSGDAGAPEDTAESVSPWWPCLAHLSWQSIGYPLTQTFSSTGSELGTHSGQYPMFTLAIEHRQSQRPHPTSGLPVYRDDLNLAIRLQDACLVHWPNLEPNTDIGASASAMPSWLVRLLQMLETPSVTVVTTVWPGYQLTDALVIQHIHLERLFFTWTTPDLDPGLFNPCSHSLPSLRSVRALIGCESISLTVNTASEACITPGGDTIGSAAAGTPGGATIVTAPGMLIMSFVSNAALFLYPILRTNPPGLEHLPPIAGSCTTTNTPASFLKWLKSFKLSECVCVADLDHVELRCYSDPMRVPSSNSFITRVDVRSTNNLLRLHTCADSLAAVQNLLEALTVPSGVGSSASSSTGAFSSKPGHEVPGPAAFPTVVSADVPISRTTNSPTSFGSRSSLHSYSPRHFNSKPSVETFLASGSGSSVEDLLQGAISDVDSPQGSPYRQINNCSHSPSKNLFANTISRPSSSNTSRRSPEPRPCRTRCSDVKPPMTTGLYPHPGSEESALCSAFTSTRHSQAVQPDSCSPDSSPTEFVVIKPSMVPIKPMSSSGTREHVRCLLPTPTANAGTSDVAGSVGGFDLCENYYPTPTCSVIAGTRNRMHRLFTDPPSVYPRASLALTLYNFSMEWNIYGGLDLIPPKLTGGSADQFRGSPNTSQTPTPEHKLSKTSSGTGLTGAVVGDTRGQSVKGGGEVSSGAAKIAGLNAAGGLKPGVRFRHDRPTSAMFNPTPLSNTSVASTQSVTSNSYPGRVPDAPATIPSTQELYTRGGRHRDATKCISIRLNKLYFRHASFPQRCTPAKRPTETTTVSSQSSSSGDPASRYVLNIGSLVVIDQVASSRINQLLYTFSAQPATLGSAVPHNVDTPLLRAAIVCWRVRNEADCSDGPMLSLPPSQGTDMVSERSAVGGAVSTGLELEAKISVQPLQINIDQNTLLFIEEFQKLFSQFAKNVSDSGEAQTSTTAHISPLTIPDRVSPQAHSATTNTVPLNPERGSEAHDSTLRSSPQAPVFHDQEDTLVPESNVNTERPGVFIRKVTFFPDLPIRLNYLGRHLDLSAGSLQGFCRMLLQLNNGQLIIPRRVYQRGYPNMDRLLEEVMNDLRASITSQLPQLIATSIGPMHEVRLFLMGLWDLIYQPMQGIYRDAGDTGKIRNAQHSQWPATEWDLSAYDLQGYSSSHDSGGSVSGSGFIRGLHRGTRSFSTSTLWASLQLSIRGVRAVQSVAETVYDLVTPGPALRSRQIRLRQPADLREGLGNAMNAMTRGFQMVTEDLCGATRLQSAVDFGCKGPVGMVGDVLRQIPPTIVTPVVAGCEMAANILGGFRNQLRPEAKVEDEQKWKDTHGL